MPLLLRDSNPENQPPGTWPAWGILVVTLAAATFLYLGFHAMRGARVAGLEGRALGIAAMAAFAAAAGCAGWIERGRRRGPA